MFAHGNLPVIVSFHFTPPSKQFPSIVASHPAAMSLLDELWTLFLQPP
jgi:hypothetical protein